MLDIKQALEVCSIAFLLVTLIPVAFTYCYISYRLYLDEKEND